MSDSIQTKDTITINFISKNGKTQQVIVPTGYTIMEAARTFAEPTIDEVPGDCGGCTACGTCHINIREDIDKVGRVEYNSLENEILEMNMEYDIMYSRLGCNVMLEKKHNNLKIYLRSMESV